MKKTRVVFAKEKIKKQILNRIVKEQTERLITYAKGEIMSIGASINSYGSAYHMDRTGNLLDSLCWAVYYGGKLKDFGYYRKDEAAGISRLHEWSKPQGQEVDGYLLAEQFITTYTPQTQNGWELFFAVLAPYWGYWEKGHVNVKNGSFQQFAVMTQFHDKVKQDLSPARVTFRTYIPA